MEQHSASLVDWLDVNVADPQVQPSRRVVVVDAERDAFDAVPLGPFVKCLQESGAEPSSAVTIADCDGQLGSALVDEAVAMRRLAVHAIPRGTRQRPGDDRDDSCIARPAPVLVKDPQLRMTDDHFQFRKTNVGPSRQCRVQHLPQERLFTAIEVPNLHTTKRNLAVSAVRRDGSDEWRRDHEGLDLS